MNDICHWVKSQGHYDRADGKAHYLKGQGGTMVDGWTGGLVEEVMLSSWNGDPPDQKLEFVKMEEPSRGEGFPLTGVFTQDSFRHGMGGGPRALSLWGLVRSYFGILYWID